MGRTKRQINEIFILRTIACLSIVLLHVTAATLNLNNITALTRDILTAAQMLLVFGTPVFVFISEFLLSINSTVANKKFFIKRFKYLMLPFFFMALLYAFIEVGAENSVTLIKQIILNIFFAGYSGYFVIIVFQFYFLHFLFEKYFRKWKAKYVLPVSLIINIAYLAFFNFVPPLEFIPSSHILWYRFSWMPFVGWIFYFTLGYYSGKHFDLFQFFITKYRHYLISGSIISLITAISLQHLGYPDLVSSKRVDVLILTTFMILTLFYLASYIKNVPSVIYSISNYSFCIFLLHGIFITVFKNLFVETNINTWIYLLSSFFFSIICSIIVANITNRLPIGKYIVGNINTFKSSNPQSIKTVKSHRL